MQQFEKPEEFMQQPSPHDPYLPDAQTQGFYYQSSRYTPTQPASDSATEYAQGDSTEYTPGLYSQVGGYAPPPPPLGGYAPPLPLLSAQSQPRQLVHFPLLHGKAGLRDILVILGCSIAFILATIFFLLPGDGFFFVVWSLVVLPAATLLVGKLLGSWRGLLYVLLSALGLVGLLGLKVVAFPILNEGVIPSFAYLPLLGIPVAAWLMGWIYERRQTMGCLLSGWTTLLGSLIVAAGLVGMAALGQPSFNVPLYLFAGESEVSYTYEILGLAILMTISTLVLEGIAYLITSSTVKRKASMQPRPKG